MTGAPHALFSAAWLRMAATVAAPHAPDPGSGSAVRIGLRLTDASGDVADRVLLLADMATGALEFTAGEWGERPAMTLALSRADALVLLFGDGEQRVRLFEHGGLRLEGVFLFVFFLDRVLQQDPAGVVARLRELTAGPPPRGPEPTGGAASAGDPAVAEGEALDHARERLPLTMAALRHELGRTTPGAQLYVSGADTTVSVALGEARPGVPFTRDALPIWYCCSKPFGAVAVGQLWERGLLDPEHPVAAYLPWFTGDGRETVTLRQLLTHTSVVPMGLDPLHGSMTAPLPLRREQVRTMAVPRDALPGSKITYAPWWAWFLLSEVVRAVDGRDYERYLAEEILTPCGMTDTRVVLAPEEYQRLASRLPLIHITGGGLPSQPTHWFATEASCTRPVHGLNMRGPMADLGLFFEALANGGLGRQGRILRAQTVAALTARHRVGLRDDFGNADWGLGFRVESRYVAEECTAFGHHASLRSFGHYGLWTSAAFADPDAGLVVALHLNGKTWQEDHQRRLIAVCDAVYRDLGLDRAAAVHPGGPGRALTVPPPTVTADQATSPDGPER
ncbi:serine hydrolase domain-containing protein [Streptomyces luteireticuli]|uniref:Beta-lactamase-related domain-containing protein n=1 Tax=Streptomyces luteireticuli TaxID=173858 RepID=A0ABN0YH00_9ACTN